MQTNVSALGAFTFVEAAILLVAVAVLFLVWARSPEGGFHLPGGDGVAIVMAGGWALLLLVCRLFDKPDVQGAGATIGIQWGIFGAMLAAGALIAAGAAGPRDRTRPSRRTPPPTTPAGCAAPRRERERTPDRRPRDATAVTELLRDRPAWEGDIGEPPPTTRLDDAPDHPSAAPLRGPFGGARRAANGARRHRAACGRTNRQRSIGRFRHPPIGR